MLELLYFQSGQYGKYILAQMLNTASNATMRRHGRIHFDVFRYTLTGLTFDPALCQKSKSIVLGKLQSIGLYEL
jgi:hypothetical protein